MKKWFKEHCIDFIVAVVTVLSYLGIDATDLLGISQYATYIMPFIYISAGIFAGWRIKSYIQKRNSWSIKYLAKTATNSPTSIKEIIASFSNAPFEMKVFLKATLEHSATYRETADCAWEYFAASLDPIIKTTSICNNISRCTIREEARVQFEKNPELFQDVTNYDITSHAVRGTEGIKPCVFSSNQLIWWYYTDDQNIPEPIDLIGFMRRPPVS